MPLTDASLKYSTQQTCNRTPLYIAIDQLSGLLLYDKAPLQPICVALQVEVLSIYKGVNRKFDISVMFIATRTVIQ